MKAVVMFALLVYTCGAFAYGSLIVLWLREWRTPRVDGLADPLPARAWELELIGAVLQVVCFIWFVVLALAALLDFGPQRQVWSLEMARIWLSCTFPPLIMHMSYAELAAEERLPAGRIWRAALWSMYVGMQAVAISSILAFAGAFAVRVPLVVRVLTISIATGFIIAAVYAIWIAARARRAPETPRQQQLQRWHLGLFLIVVLLFVLIISVAMRQGAPGSTVFVGLLNVAATSLPLAFLFVAAYFESRFAFIDLFVKRGLSLLLTFAILTGAFALALPVLRQFESSGVSPWIHAIVFLPLVTALPWLYGRIGATLDRRWLGRRFTTVEAVKHFLAGLRSAANEEQLIERAEQSLSEIFDATVEVQLRPDANAPSFHVAQEVAIRPGEASLGRILMSQRASEAPYFSEDVALLTSLADVLASVVDNLRLQRREQEQDQRERELTLHASRSELKALRAQINPHFLFNALNAIAGLIHKSPALADRTIEQLADVFRYALRGTESEWALLDEEFEFVRAYLEIEQARFGARLRIDVRLADNARGARIPTMMVQTLVENAVKHGVALVRGSAAVEVDARRENGRLIVTVADTGPGFAAATSRPGLPGKSGGYGLANIRQRLEGYFSGHAALTIDRDARAGRTIVAVSLPFEPHVHHAGDAGRRMPSATTPASTAGEPRT
jgi:hypothetical protein